MKYGGGVGDVVSGDVGKYIFRVIMLFLLEDSDPSNQAILYAISSDAYKLKGVLIIDMEFIMNP